MKVIIKSLVCIALIMSFTSCGSSDEEDTPNTQETIPLVNEVCVQDYYDLSITGILTPCMACHIPTGDARQTSLVFTSTSNYETLKSYILSSSPARLIIEKNDGTRGHKGGKLFNADAVSKMEVMIDYIANPTQCKTSSSVGLLSSDIVLNTPEKALSTAAVSLLGRAATPSELGLAKSEAGLDAVLDDYMTRPEFYEFIHRSFNDLFLSDSARFGGATKSISLNGYFRYWKWYTNLPEERTLNTYSNYGSGSAVIELIKHVVKEDRPFSEILTADYTMVNPYSSRLYGLEIPSFSFPDDGSIEDYSKDKFIETKLPDKYLAGLLTDPGFLMGFPTTPTNLNRHRSLKIQKMFLDVDILALSSRAIATEEEDTDPHPNFTNPNCTVCHLVMEPIAGLFKNYQSDFYAVYKDREWEEYMQVPGYSINEPLPEDKSANALQWLAQKIAEDDRFLIASVKIFYKALTARDSLVKPDSSSTSEYIQAYNLEIQMMQEIALKFKNSKMNTKTLIKDLLKSPLMRAISLPNGVENEILEENIGMHRLISPEVLDEKIKDATGFYWTYSGPLYKGHEQQLTPGHSWHRLLGIAALTGGYKVLYGGVVNGTSNTRVTETNSIIAAIQIRMSLAVSCQMTGADLYMQKSERAMFPFVEKDLEPSSPENIQMIKQNIQHLHKRFLNEDLAINDAKITATYDLFIDIYERVKADTSRKALFLEGCSVKYDPITGEALDEADILDTDTHYVIQAWQVVIAHLLRDYKFLYNTTAK